MKLTTHAIFSIPLGCLCYGITRSFESVVGVIIGGILIDLDHFLEFWYDNGFALSVKKFFLYCNHGNCTRFFIIFHSYELILLFLIISQNRYIQFFLAGLIASMILHIFLDYINIIKNYNYKWYSFIVYFFVFRLLFKFDREKIDSIVRRIPGD